MTTAVVIMILAALVAPNAGWAETPTEHSDWEKRVVLPAGQEIQGIILPSVRT